MPDRAVILETEQARVSALPTVGGAIASYRVKRSAGLFDILRPTDERDTAQNDPRNLTCFPLVPYSNRIRDGRFRFEGRDVALPLNFGDHPHSIHGHGWQSAWSVDRVGEAEAILRYEHAADAWPWAYRAVQRMALEQSDLLLALSLENLGAGPMPAGLGFHPYFPRHGGARLTAAVDEVWLVDDEVMPTRRAALPDRWALPDGVDVDGLDCDNLFEGWTGTACVRWPADGADVILTASEALRRLVVYAPAGEDFFCAEPVSHITDAFNLASGGRADTGMQVLRPGESLAGWMRLTPRKA